MGTGSLGSTTALAAGGLVLIATYAAVAGCLKVEELNGIRDMVRGRLGR